MRRQKKIIWLGILLSFSILAICLFGIINPLNTLEPLNPGNYMDHGLTRLKNFSFLLLITGLFIYELNIKRRI